MAVFEMSIRSKFGSLARTFGRDADNDEIEDYSMIQTKFHMKECSTLVSADENGKQRCGCGRLKNDHEQDIKTTQNEVWSSSKHSEEMPTDSFGLVSFSEEDQDAKIASKYARIADNTSPEMVWFLLNRIWKLKPPTLVLSILGGNRIQNFDDTIKRSLEEGLTKLIKAMDVWLVTGATDTVITKNVSSTFQDNFRKKNEQRNACIGIGPWGCIGWRDQLAGESNQVVYRPLNESETKKNLCEKHTHFLLVDDGSINRYGTERKLRSALEFYLSSTGGDAAIPVINLLVCGGYSACMQVKENLRSSKTIPIVVIKGSGGFADALEASLHKYNDEHCSGVKLQEYIQNAVEEHMALSTENSSNVLVTSAIKEMVEQHKSQIFVFDPSKDPYGLHHAIIEASKASSKGSEQKDRLNRLQLAIHLDEIEVAKHDLQQENADVEFVRTALYKAIKSGKFNFVQFLLTYGVNLKGFLGENKEMLRKLYGKIIKKDEFFGKLVTYSDKKKFFRRKMFDLKTVDRLLQKHMDEDYNASYSTMNGAITPSQDLMFWAVFNDMFDMVDCFWKHETKKALENAVVLFRLYQSMSSDMRGIDEEKRKTLRSHAKTFEQRAVDLLSLCYADAPDAALEVIKTEIPLWGNQNLITLAANGRSLDFVSHTCCQNYLNEIWRGQREMSENRLRKKHTKKSKHVAIADATDFREQPGACKKFFRSIKAIFRFLFFVPKGKLVLHMFMYLIFLACFTYKLLIKEESVHRGLWIYVNIFVAAMTVEKICEVLNMQKKTLYMKFKEWFHSMWKKMDVLAIILFYIGMGLKFKFDTGSRAVLAFALVMWIVKFSQFYRMIHSLGPYLTMVYRMLLHMSSFILVLLTVVLAFGIFLYAFLYPSESVSWMLLFKMLFRPYLLVFGELGISTYTIEEKTTVFGTTKLGSARELIAVLGVCAYILIANVLLLNMLIAVFNNIYEEIKENSDKIWKFDRYYLIMEYSKKPSLPPPLSAVLTVIQLARAICICSCTCVTCAGSLPRDVLLEMDSLQHACMKELLGNDNQKTDFVENMIKSIKERVDGNTKALIELNEKIDDRFAKIEKMLNMYLQKVTETGSPESNK